MILPVGDSINDLNKYLDGKIEMGKGVGAKDLDRHMVHKDGEFSIILGHDNVGKTYFFEWWMLALSSKHDITWTVWLGENKKWQALRDMIQWYSGRPFKDLTHKEVQRYSMMIEHWFKFVDNSRLYTPNEMLDIFASSDSDAYFIDPFTGLDRSFSHEANYQFLNHTRQFVNSTKKSIYMSSHPNSESGRAGRLYPKEHEWHGHLMPPLKDHIEGGKPFINRVDNVYVCHRLIKHERMRFYTMIDTAKVKDQETGGKITGLDNPVLCDWNSGLGFKISGVDPLERKVIEKPNLTPNLEFDKPQEIEVKEDTPIKPNETDFF